MALADDFAAAQDPRVIAQVTAAIYAEAENVYTEGTGVTNHATRAAFATAVSTGKQDFSPLILSACSFGSLTASSPDQTVSNSVATLWSLWAQA